MDSLITWHEHSQQIKAVYNDLFENERLTDVTLVCSDHVRVKAHKIILMSCSNMFRSMFDDDNSDMKTMIYLRGISEFQVKKVLEFMYKGQVKIEMDKLNTFLQVASDLEMNDLMNPPEPSGNNDNEKNTDIAKKEQSEPNDIDHVTHNSEDKKETKKLSLEERRPFQCDKCEFRCKTKKQFYTHSQRVHQDLMYSCKHCDFKAVYNAELRLHTMSEHMDQTKLISCDECKFQTTTPALLKLHQEAKHLGIRYPCDKCEHVASGPSSLRKHVIRRHSGVRNRKYTKRYN